jgi:hypothetical protein
LFDLHPSWFDALSIIARDAVVFATVPPLPEVKVIFPDAGMITGVVVDGFTGWTRLKSAIEQPLANPVTVTVTLLIETDVEELGLCTVKSMGCAAPPGTRPEIVLSWVTVTALAVPVLADPVPPPVVVQ